LIALPPELVEQLEAITRLPLHGIAPSIQNWAGWQWQQLVKERRATRLSGGVVGEAGALGLFRRELPKRIEAAGPPPEGIGADADSQTPVFTPWEG
jgi:hypothetical protein